MTDSNTLFKSGFVSLAGEPNVGKSTLLNRILGEKISITSKKPQTTRNRILGIAHRPMSQIVFIDTPGIHTARNRFNKRIVDTALTSLKDVDLIIWVADGTLRESVSGKIRAQILTPLNTPVILALNKIDLIEKQVLLSLIDICGKAYPFKEIVPISAKKGTQVDELVTSIEKYLPSGPALFPEDSVTDLPERFITAEIIREKVFRLTGEEIPYATAVTVEEFTENKKKALTAIHATIHVERDSQKGILIGKGGSKLKRIGEEARKDIESMLGNQVFLKLFVHVQKNWRKDARALSRFGY
jgi:GTP-binding protein Era